MSVLVNKPGLLTTVQDLGRYGAQQYGVIAGGAMDAFALRVANLLVGNEEGDAALEITMLGPELLFERPTLLSVCGGDLCPELDGVPVPRWTTVFAPKGSRLRFGRPRQGCRAYLAIGGGLDVPLEMNSRSTSLRAGIGGFRGRALRAGDRIPFRAWSARSRGLLGVLTGHAEERSGSVAVSRWTVANDLLPPYSPDPTVDAIAGGNCDRFREDGLHRFFNEPFTVLPQSDRMGYRLAGSELVWKERTEMISSAVTFGTVQVPADGNPIVLMADRQTTGGYPIIAQVASADLPLLAQARLGSRVRFRLISLREAQNKYVRRELGIRKLRNGLDQLHASRKRI